MNIKLTNTPYISIFGKSTVPKNDSSYIFTKNLAAACVENGYGILHGGYAGGLMEAASEGAQIIIDQKNLSKELNIGIPQAEHDAVGWDRVSTACFTTPAKHIYERLEFITGNCDVAVVAPRGGDGTMLELMTLMHINVISEYANYAPTPIILTLCEGSTDWISILNDMLAKLDTSKQSITDFDWLHVCDSIEETMSTIQKILD